MTERIITIIGLVLSNGTKKGIPNLKVEAWDKDMRVDTPVGSAVTDSDGRYNINFSHKKFIEMFKNQKTDLFFKIISKDHQVESTEKTILWNIGIKKSQIKIYIDLDKKQSWESTTDGERVKVDQKPKGKGGPDDGKRIIEKEFRKMQTLEFGKIAGLKPDKVEKLAENNFDWSSVNDSSLLPFVQNKTLTDSEKNDLLVTADLTRLTGDNLPLIKVLKTPQLKSLETFVTWENGDWINLIKINRISLPDGQDSVESYAEYIRHNIEKMFPSQYFLKRIVKDKYDGEFKLLETVECLHAKNNKIILVTSVNSGKLNRNGINESARKNMEMDLAALSEFANMYRHLGIPEIVNNWKLDKVAMKDAILKRINALKKFLNNNSYLDLFQDGSLFKEDTFKWEGIDPEDQEPVKSQLLAYQRVQTLTDDYRASETLLKKGFDSAVDIANMGEDEFMESSGLEYKVGRLVYFKAKQLIKHPEFGHRKHI